MLRYFLIKHAAQHKNIRHLRFQQMVVLKGHAKETFQQHEMQPRKGIPSNKQFGLHADIGVELNLKSKILQYLVAQFTYIFNMVIYTVLYLIRVKMTALCTFKRCEHNFWISN